MELKNLNTIKIKIGGGDLSEMLGVTTYHDFNYEIAYKPEVTAQVSYPNEEFAYYLATFTNESASDDRNLVLFGDSFRTAQNQFFAKDFKKYTTIHYGRSSLINENINILSEADIIVLSMVERYDGSIQHVKDIMQLIKNLS